MPAYLFHLGHCPELSHAEIAAVNDRLHHPFHHLRRDGTVLLGDCESSEAAVLFCKELAGTIRLAEVIFDSAGPVTDIGAMTPEELAKYLQDLKPLELCGFTEKRPAFGFSLLMDKRYSRKYYGLLHDTASILKESFKEEEVSCRFVLPLPDSESFSLGSAQVDKNKLITGGVEFVIHYSTEKNLRIGVTKWIQGYEEFSKRDYGRPQRDSRSGMLPPKLACMMINLARTANTVTIIDPFCGSGSVLNEAALMGLKSTGVDNSAKAINDTRANWKWIKERSADCQGDVRAVEGDVRELRKLCEPLYFDACVTEPYMGPPQKKPLTKDFFKKISGELKNLYIRALGEIRTVVKPGSRVIFIVPKFLVQETAVPQSINITPQLRMQGYRFLDPFLNFSPVTHKKSIIYSRPDQIVQREIFIMEA